jgi:Ras-related protein Rab-21
MEYKVVLLGDSGVGKSSLATIYHMIYNGIKNFEQVESTIGAAFFRWRIKTAVSPSEIILQVWDTAGQERYKALAPIYLRGCDAVLLVYDINSYRSMRNIDNTWLTILSTDINNSDGKMPLLYLIGNKIDTVSADYAISTSEDLLNKLRNMYPTMQKSILTSIRDQKTIEALFGEIAVDLAKKYPKSPLTDLESPRHLQIPASQQSKCCSGNSHGIV